MRLAMLAAVLGLLLAAPAKAEARGWHGGGHIGIRGGFFPRARFFPRAHFAPRIHFAPIGLRVFVPGYWGWGARGTYAIPAQQGAVWVPPGWNWDPARQQWFWREGYWSY
jgi:hypothetical protein